MELQEKQVCFQFHNIFLIMGGGASAGKAGRPLITGLAPWVGELNADCKALKIAS